MRRTLNLLFVIVLLIAALIWLVPLIWTLLMSVRPPDESLVYLNMNGTSTVNIFVGTHLTLQNFGDAFGIVNWGQEYISTLIFVFGVLAVQLVTITLSGYAFARMQFFGKRVLFGLILVQLMIPSAVLLVPNFATIHTLNLFDTRLGMMLPYFGSAFGTFLMRQTFKQVPLDLEDAARIDGCDWWRILRHVYLPSSIPTLTAFALVSISAHWNEFLWPFMITQSANVRVLTAGLGELLRTEEVGAQYGHIAAGVLIVTATLLVLFVIFQRQFINSFLRSGLK
ncbi:MAG: carbohydrate ABC transporter permease [Aggregatilineales bacterium]